MKNLFAIKNAPAFLLLAVLAAAGPFASGLHAQAQKTAASRSMEQAIRLYHEGEDTEAMDRFMDILAKGSPSEKALANEYITKITTRLNTGVPTVKDNQTEGGTVNVVAPKDKGVMETKRGDSPAADEDQDDTGDRAAQEKDSVNEKISAKITQMRRDLLVQLSRVESVKIYMGDDMPKAITLDSNYFFAGETSFRPGTDQILTNVAGLIFTLGRANCLILPEGAAGGDVKIKSIRRALALNSYLEARGVSKSRLDVNLTGSDIQFPKELTNISGIVILFDYKKEPRLKDLEDVQTKGPKVSLGVYPTAISVNKSEGAVVEFSAFDSPIGPPTWTFQVFQVMKDGSRLQLQEISGSGSQYNQSFWNGRKKFFGAAYPSGKYIFTVSAKDVEGRETTLSRFLSVRPTPEEERAMAAKPAAKPARSEETVTPSGVKTHVLKAGGAGLKTGKALKGKKGAAAAAAAAAKKGKTAGKKGKAATAAAKKGAHKPAGKKAVKKAADAGDEGGADATQGTEGTDGATDGADAGTDEGADAAKPAKKAAPAEGGDAPAEFSGQVSYKIYFKENTATITANSEKKLAQVAETLGYYPMANIALTGYAYSGEANAQTMAENRVNYVASRLTEKYKIDHGRMDIKSHVSDTPKSTVEIKMTGNE